TFLTYSSLPVLFTLSLHDALPICSLWARGSMAVGPEATAASWAMSVSIRTQANFTVRISSCHSGTIFLKGSRNWICRRRMSLKRSEEHTSELQSRVDLVCRLLLEK